MGQSLSAVTPGTPQGHTSSDTIKKIQYFIKKITLDKHPHFLCDKFFLKFVVLAILSIWYFVNIKHVKEYSVAKVNTFFIINYIVWLYKMANANLFYNFSTFIQT